MIVGPTLQLNTVCAVFFLENWISGAGSIPSISGHSGRCLRRFGRFGRKGRRISCK